MQDSQVYVFAFVGRSDDSKTNNKLPILPEENEARSYLATGGDTEDTALRKSFRLQAGERRGWWSHHPHPAGKTDIALVQGAVCDHRVKILLDSGSTTSILSLDLARKLGLTLSHDQRLKVKGIGGVTTYVTSRATAKITLGMSIVYVLDLWVGNIGEGIDCLLGMDFMVCAGVRLSAYEGKVQLPDEERVPLIAKGARPKLPTRITVQTAGELYILPGRCAFVPVVYGRKQAADLQVWSCRAGHWVTSVVAGKDGLPNSIRVTNISSQPLTLAPRTVVAHFVDPDHLPLGEKCARFGSVKYEEWQVLAYENSHSREFIRRQDDVDDAYNASLPPPVEKVAYNAPTTILSKGGSSTSVSGSRAGASSAPVPSSEERPTPAKLVDHTAELGGSQADVLVAVSDPVAKAKAEQAEVEETGPVTIGMKLVRSPNQVFKPVERLVRIFKILASSKGEVDDTEAVSFYHEGSDHVILEKLRDQLAVLPDVIDIDPPVDMNTADVGEPGETSVEDDATIRNLLLKHSVAFLGSGNALPPPARGVVCDIEVDAGTVPIAEKPRRIKSHLLPQVYELLKKLLEAMIIEYSDSEWASPIVIVMKKDGVMIRLCIDYRRVNQLIKLMNYPLPLIDDLLSNFEAAMWFLSLDMASGFWAVEMTRRAKHISAFVCPLGHFQWVRMPFGLKNAPLIYQKVIDNALWGYVRLPAHLEAEVDPEVLEALGLEPVSDANRAESQQKNAGKTVFQLGIPTPKCLGPVLGRSSYIDDIAYGTKTWDELLLVLDRLLYRLRYWRISISLPKSAFGKRSIQFLSHEVTRDGIVATPKIANSLRELPFPTSLKGVQSFLGSLNYYNKFIEDYSVVASVLDELTDERIRSDAGLESAKHAFELLKDKILSPPMLHHPDRAKPFVIIPHANQWAVGAVLGQEVDGLVVPVRFVGRTLHDAELNYHVAEKEVLAILRVLSVYYTLVAGQKLIVYTRFSTLKWILNSKSVQGRILQWSALLSPWTMEVRKVERDEDGLAALVAASITPREKLDEVAAELVPLKAMRVKPTMVSVEMLDAEYVGYVLSFDGAAKLKSQAGSASFIIWKLPAWDPVYSKSIYLENVTVNQAEYQGLLQGLEFLIEQKLNEPVERLVVVGDSRIVVQQCQGIIGCNQPHLMLLLNQFHDLKLKFESIDLVHAKREYNGAANYLAGLALRSGETRVLVDELTFSQLRQLNDLPSRMIRPSADPVVGPPVSHSDAAEAGSVSTDSTEMAGEGDELAAAGENSLRIESVTVEPVDVSGEATVLAVTTRARARDAVPVPIVTRRRASADAGNPESAPAEAGQVVDQGRDAGPPPPRPVVRVTEGRSIDEAVDERWRRIRAHQDADKEVRELKAFLQGDVAALMQQDAVRLAKIADQYVLDDDKVLRYVSLRPSAREKPAKLVVPVSMRQDVLHLCHNEFQGGHQGVTRTYERARADYYWTGMYRDVVQHCVECVDCSTGKGAPPNHGPSPGNIQPEYPFHVVSMDFMTPLPASEYGNTSLLLFQCMFSGYIMCKAMSDISAPAVAKVYDEVVFQRFGASSLLRHDQDPAFMSEVFTQFRAMLGSRQRATLAYRPQANGQQERSVQTVSRSIKAFVSRPGQDDWEDVVYRLMFTLNTSYDATRHETPFYLVHGWDAKNTVAAMVAKPPSKRRGNRYNAYLWRIRMQRDYQYALAWARDLQVKAKKKRADSRTADWNALPPRAKTGLEVGDAVWLYLARVKPGLTRKLAHHWHGPFRIIEKANDHRVRLKTEGTMYRLNPWVHVSRLKPRILHPERPTGELEPVPEDLDWDAALLPEDSWEPDREAGEYEMEAILDVKWESRRTRAGNKKHRFYKVKFVGYDEPEWIAANQVKAGSLLYKFDNSRRGEARYAAMQSGDGDASEDGSQD